MRETCTYGLTRGRAYPTRGAPLYSTCIDTLTRAMARLLDSTRSTRSTRLKNRDTFAAVFACLKSHFPAVKLFYDLRLDLRIEHLSFLRGYGSGRCGQDNERDAAL